jgi:hypothetical protein
MVRSWLTAKNPLQFKRVLGVAYGFIAIAFTSRRGGSATSNHSHAGGLAVCKALPIALCEGRHPGPV